MKVLQIFVLSAIVISYVAESCRSPKKGVAKGFAKAIKRGRSESIKMGEGSLHHDVNIDDMIQTRNLWVIVSSIKKFGQANKRTLRKLCRIGPQAVKRVLEMVTFPQKVLAGVASSSGLACNPDLFFTLVKKITVLKNQTSTVVKGIESIPEFRRSTCIPRLLKALNSESFNNEHLNDVAIQTMFKKAVIEDEDYDNPKYQHLFKHPAITPENYASFIIQTEKANERALRKLYEKMPVETVKRVLEIVTFPQEALINLASSKELTCHPEGFLMLLNRMRSEADRITAIERGIDNLFAQTDRQCIPPLLIAMKGRPLESVAVKRAFEGATKAVKDYEPGVLWCTFDHPTITREIYAKTLFALAKRNTLSQTLKWLLERADKHDLDALQAISGYDDMTSDIHASIDHAKRKASDRTLRIPAPATLSTPTDRGSYNNLHPHMPEYEQLFGYGI